MKFTYLFVALFSFLPSAFADGSVCVQDVQQFFKQRENTSTDQDIRDAIRFCSSGQHVHSSCLWKTKDVYHLRENTTNDTDIDDAAWYCSNGGKENCLLNMYSVYKQRKDTRVEEDIHDAELYCLGSSSTNTQPPPPAPTPIPNPEGYFTFNASSYLKAAPVQASELSQNQKCAIDAGTKVWGNILRNAEGNHYLVQLTATVPNCAIGAWKNEVYIYAPHVR